MIINRGRLVVESPLSELTAPSRRDGSRRGCPARRPREGAAQRRCRATERENGTLHVHGVTAERVGEIALAAHVELRELVAESSSLEDVFLELTAEPPS